MSQAALSPYSGSAFKALRLCDLWEAIIPWTCDPGQVLNNREFKLPTAALRVKKRGWSLWSLLCDCDVWSWVSVPRTRTSHATHTL